MGRPSGASTRRSFGAVVNLLRGQEPIGGSTCRPAPIRNRLGVPCSRYTTHESRFSFFFCFLCFHSSERLPRLSSALFRETFRRFHSRNERPDRVLMYKRENRRNCGLFIEIFSWRSSVRRLNNGARQTRRLERNFSISSCRNWQNVKKNDGQSKRIDGAGHAHGILHG